MEQHLPSAQDIIAPAAHLWRAHTNSDYGKDYAIWVWKVVGTHASDELFQGRDRQLSSAMP